MNTTTRHHPDSDYIGMKVAQRNGRRVGMVDDFCWAFGLVLFLALCTLWWPS